MDDVFGLIALSLSAVTFWWTSMRGSRLSVVPPPFVWLEPVAALGQGIRLRVSVPLVVYTQGVRPQPVVMIRAALRHPGGIITFSRWRMREGEDVVVCPGGVATQEGWSAQHCLVAETKTGGIEAGEAKLKVSAVPAKGPTRYALVKFTITEEAAENLNRGGQLQIFRDSSDRYVADEGRW